MYTHACLHACMHTYIHTYIIVRVCVCCACRFQIRSLPSLRRSPVTEVDVGDIYVSVWAVPRMAASRWALCRDEAVCLGSWTAKSEPEKGAQRPPSRGLRV